MHHEKLVNTDGIEADMTSEKSEKPRKIIRE